jgi:predicted nucleic acid-binding protein
MGVKLKSGDIVFLDTAPFIYFFEKNPDYFPALETFFDQLYETGAQAITSIVTYIELTTQPARKGNRQLVRKYRDYLSNSQNLSLFPLDMDIADHVVELRATYHFTTPDAIQIGTAVACGADYIITNDKSWQRFKEIKVMLIDAL